MTLTEEEKTYIKELFKLKNDELRFKLIDLKPDQQYSNLGKYRLVIKILGSLLGETRELTDEDYKYVLTVKPRRTYGESLFLSEL